MGSALLSELATEILIPVCAVIGIAFSLVQWFLVSRVKLTHERPSSSNDKKNGFNDYLIEEEEGINDQSVVAKCADIQNAISEGEAVTVRSQDFGSRSGVFLLICLCGVFLCLVANEVLRLGRSLFAKKNGEPIENLTLLKF